MWKNRIAVSPVIATIILLAVVLSVSVAVAYWAAGASNQYAKIEKLEIAHATMSAMSSEGSITWTVSMTIKNAGTRSVTINDVYLSDVSLANSGTTSSPNPPLGNGGWYTPSRIIASGSSSTLVIVIKNGGVTQPFTSLSHGVSVSFRIHTGDGFDYLKLTELI